MTGAPALVATGGIIIDNIIAADGAVHLETLGGNAVYAAAGARLWEPSVGVAGVVPADYPQHWLDRLAAARIDTAGVSREEETGLASEWFFHRPDGSRVDHLHADAGAFAAEGLRDGRITPAEARAFEERLRSAPPQGPTFKDFRARHPVTPERLPAAFLLAKAFHLAPNAAPAQRRLASSAASRGALVTLDPGYAAQDLAPGLEDLLPLLDAFLPSEKELAVLVPGADPAHAARALVDRGARLVVAKLGSRGALAVTREGAVEIPVVPIVAIDPTGAGDAFCGGFLAALARTGNAVAAACCGAVSASFAVERFGCLGLLEATRGEALPRLRALTSFLPAAARDALGGLLSDTGADCDA